MNLTSKRLHYAPDGILSSVSRDDTGERLLVTLEHAYDQHDLTARLAPQNSDHLYWPKLPPGVYTCVRGVHALHDGKVFETFEVSGVAGHSGVLFHHGNWNEDSEGCILTGDAEADAPDPKAGGSIRALVTNTNVAFARFMAAMTGVDSFQLTVEA